MEHASPRLIEKAPISGVAFGYASHRTSESPRLRAYLIRLNRIANVQRILRFEKRRSE